jgi:hypothetical protein
MLKLMPGLGRGAHALAGDLFRQLEGVADDALGAHAGEHVVLDRDFPRRALVHAPAHVGVLPLVVFAHHHEVDVAGSARGQWGFHAGQQLDRAYAGVLLEAAPDQDETLQRNVVQWRTRPRPEYRVERAQLVQPSAGIIIPCC